MLALSHKSALFAIRLRCEIERGGLDQAALIVSAFELLSNLGTPRYARFYRGHISPLIPCPPDLFLRFSLLYSPATMLSSVPLVTSPTKATLFYTRARLSGSCFHRDHRRLKTIWLFVCLNVCTIVAYVNRQGDRYHGRYGPSQMYMLVW